MDIKNSHQYQYTVPKVFQLEIKNTSDRIKLTELKLDDRKKKHEAMVNGISKTMKEYKLTVTPSLVEMKKKYPLLYVKTKQLEDIEDEMERAQLMLTQLQRKYRQLMSG